MNSSLWLSADAENDLHLLGIYLQANFGQATRTRVISVLVTRMAALSDYPQLGHAIAQLGDPRLTGFYYYPMARNTVLYDVDQITHQVKVLRILNNRQDVMQAMTQYLLESKQDYLAEHRRDDANE